MVRTAATPGEQPGIRPLGRWRNLRLPIKLAVVTLVPMIVMVTLGVILVDGQLAHAAQYARANRITQLSSSVRSSISALQDERQQVAGQADKASASAGAPMNMPTGKATNGPGKAASPSGGTGPDQLATARHEVDMDVASTRQAVGTDSGAGDLDPVATGAWSAADRQLGELASLRSTTSVAKPNRSSAVDSYTQLIDSLFAFDRVLTTDLADAQLTRQALSVYDLFAAREEVRYQQSVVLAGIGTKTMSVADVTSLHGSEARLASRISDFRAVASQSAAHDFNTGVNATALSRQNTLLGQAIDQSGGMTGRIMPGMMIEIPAPMWDAANQAVTTGMDKVTGSLAGSLQGSAASLRAGAGGAAATAVIVLVIALAATVALVILIARQLVRSIGLLRRTARDVASRQLPDAVERIRAGESVDATVAPVGVDTTDEVGQLARAFDAVHGEALRLAVEQANLRANYSELFVNLSRRSQSLVQRQLRLIEQLERDEEDPDQLSALFKLDHLATRMRRNNENLMVLSGGELARGTGQQVSLADLVRASVSEIEHYQRVVVQPPPDAHIVGYAAGDLVRLLAELLDNATAFSAPDTPVTVASHRTRRKAVVIDIVDHGIGMSDEELVRANEQLSHPAGVEGRISRRMGLFVISRLAGQHDVRVRLHGGQDIPGLRVTITVPAELVVSETEALPPTPRDGGPSTGGGGGGLGGGGPLPKRTAGATSGPNGAWHSASLSGTLDAPAAAPTTTSAPASTSAPDASANALTVTIPALPSALSSGVGLFAPLSDEDEATAGPVDGGGEADAERTEITPIYDTLSAWFEDTPSTAAAATTDAAPEPQGWQFAADEGWQAVGAVADVEPAEFTTVGLPKRQPKALLLPGSAPAGSAPETEQPAGVPAERLRHRMSGFQQGMRRARHANNQEPGAPTEDTTVLATEPVTDDVAAEPAEAVAPQPETPAEPVGLRPPAEPPVAMSVDGWSSSADEGWRAADEVADAASAGHTKAGLPRRRPKEHLLPGSAGPAAGHASATPRDAGVLRDRLSSFQRGAREGRGGEAAAVAEPIEHGFHW